MRTAFAGEAVAAKPNIDEVIAQMEGQFASFVSWNEYAEAVASGQIPASQVVTKLKKHFEQTPLAVDERCLTEYDHLVTHYSSETDDWSDAILEDDLQNRITWLKEGPIQGAVSRVKHKYEETGEVGPDGEKPKGFMWLGRTAVMHAMGGFLFHKRDFAHERVRIEVDEALYGEKYLRPGYVKIFISPRATAKDAEYDEAAEEHIADDDAVRASGVLLDENGRVSESFTESILVEDIPLGAWHSYIRDPSNVFEKVIEAEDNGSATPIMRVHGQMEAPAKNLPEGIISLVVDVLRHIEDPELRHKVESQIERFRENQVEKHQKAVNVAKRWQVFEMELARSNYQEFATLEVEAFINSMQDQWNEDDLRVILSRQREDGHYNMSRELAKIVARAKQNMLLTRAAVVTGNTEVIEQFNPDEAARIYEQEMRIQEATDNGKYAVLRFLEAQGDRQIARHNIKIPGGCSPASTGNFTSGTGDSVSAISEQSVGESSSISSAEDKKIGKISYNKCVVRGCPSRPDKVKVGGCGVCLKICQPLFDAGKDPTKIKSAQPERRPSHHTKESQLGRTILKNTRKHTSTAEQGEKQRRRSNQRTAESGGRLARAAYTSAVKRRRGQRLAAGDS